MYQKLSILDNDHVTLKNVMGSKKKNQLCQQYRYCKLYFKTYSNTKCSIYLHYLVNGLFYSFVCLFIFIIIFFSFYPHIN